MKFSGVATASLVAETDGHTTKGDGGGALWQLNGVVGQTVSQSPTDLGDFLLNDASGNQWALVFGQTLAFDGTQYLPLPFGENGNGNYSYDSTGWTRVSNKVIPFDTLAVALAKENVFDGAAANLKEHSTGKGGAAFWDYFPAGTFTVGATIFDVFDHDTLPLQLKLRIDSSVNVSQFGAFLDGTTDDTAVFKGADVVINGGVIRVPFSTGGTKVDSFSFISTFQFESVINNAGTATTTDLNAALITQVSSAVTGKLTPVSAFSLPRGVQTRSSTFNDQLSTLIFSNGTSVEYYSEQPFDLIDFTTTGVVLTDYFVNFATGNDTNDGLTTGTAWKTMNKLFTSATGNIVVHNEDDFVGFLSNTTSIRAVIKNMKFIGEGPRGKTTYMSLRDDVTKASFSWTDNSDGSWTSTVPLRVFNTMFDRRYLDDLGLPTPITVATSKANCQATPGTFFETGTTELTVHLIDGREPDPISEGGDWMPVSTEARFEIQTDNDSLLFENIDFVNNQGPAINGGFRFRSVASTTPSLAKVGLKNCNSYGSCGQGFQLYDAKNFAIESCITQYNRTDGFNYHSFVVTGGKGNYISGYEYGRCIARFSGFEGWDNQPALSDSANGTTNHDGLNLERLNTQADSTHGAVVADVGKSISENWNVRSSQPNHGTGAVPKACYWADGADTEMWLWGCYGDEATGDTKLMEARYNIKLVSNCKFTVKHLLATSANIYT